MVLLAHGNGYSYEIGTNFPNGNIPPGFGADGWGIRDVTACQWGPQGAPSGNFCVGVPETCQPGYPNGGPSQFWEGFFTTPEIALDDSFPSLYLTFNYWADFEGETATFDGLVVEFLNLTLGTTVQIDSAAQLELVPTYDDIIGSTNLPLQGLWAYCYDTRGVKQQQFVWRAVQSVDLVAAGYAVQGDTIQIQWHFSSDQFAGGQGYFMDDVFISNIPTTDEQAPTIDLVSPEHFADIPTENVAVTVKAVITDAISDVLEDSVFLYYAIEDDTIEIRAAMTAASEDSFMADVEALPYDTDVFYRIEAYDTALNRGTSPTYTFEVTNAVTLFYDDMIPELVNPAPETGSGYANRFDVPADTLYTLHKILIYLAKENGLFDMVLNRGTSQPGVETARWDSVMNRQVANTYFQFEVLDSIAYHGPDIFWAGMRHVSADTSMDPQPSIDGSKEYGGVSYQFFGGEWTENTDGEAMIRVKVKKSALPTGIGGDETAGSTLPKVFALSQNYPNPFNPQTVISYDVPETAGIAVQVEIDIYNIHGQRVRSLVNDEKEPGSYKAQWDGRNERGIAVSSGIYFYRIKAGDFDSIRKMLLLK